MIFLSRYMRHLLWNWVRMKNFITLKFTQNRRHKIDTSDSQFIIVCRASNKLRNRKRTKICAHFFCDFYIKKWQKIDTKSLATPLVQTRRDVSHTKTIDCGTIEGFLAIFLKIGVDFVHEIAWNKRFFDKKINNKCCEHSEVESFSA